MLHICGFCRIFPVLEEFVERIKLFSAIVSDSANNFLNML